MDHVPRDITYIKSYRTGKPPPANTELCTNKASGWYKLHCSSAAQAKEKIPHLPEYNPLLHEYLIDFANTVHTVLKQTRVFLKAYI